MPKPKSGESKDDFISRCIPMVIDDGSAKHNKQAAAMCSSIYDDSKKQNQSEPHNLLIHGSKISLAVAADVPLAVRQLQTGTLYYKQIVAFGKYINPLYPFDGDPEMVLDKAWGDEIVQNFDAKVIPRVPVPLDHTDDTEANTGEVIGLQTEDDGLYAFIDIRRPETVADIDGGLIFDDSISFDFDYVDNKTGDHHGAVLFHVALVNNPYLKGMKPFTKLSEAINRFAEELAPNKRFGVIMLSESKAKELSEMEKATVKNNQKYDVVITVKDDEGEEVERTLKPGEEVEVPKNQSEAVTTQILEAEDPAGAGEGGGEGGTGEEGGERGSEGGEGEGSGAGEGAGAGGGEGNMSEADKKELSDLRKKNAKLELSAKYESLLKAGKITPAQKDQFMALADVHSTKVELSGKQVSLSEVVAGILEAGPKVVNFSETGSGKGGKDPKKSKEDGAASLNEAETKGMKALGHKPGAWDETVKKHPEAAAALSSSKKREIA